MKHLVFTLAILLAAVSGADAGGRYGHGGYGRFGHYSSLGYGYMPAGQSTTAPAEATPEEVDKAIEGQRACKPVKVWSEDGVRYEPAMGCR